MAAIPTIMNGVIMILFYTLIIGLAWKVFEMAGNLAEIKTLLTEMRKTAPVPTVPQSVAPVYVAAPVYAAAPAPVVNPIPAGPISLESAEALLREIAAESHALEQAKPNV